MPLIQSYEEFIYGLVDSYMDWSIYKVSVNQLDEVTYRLTIYMDKSVYESTSRYVNT